MPNRTEIQHPDYIMALFGGMSYDELQSDLELMMGSTIRDDINDTMMLSQIWETYLALQNLALIIFDKME